MLRPDEQSTAQNGRRQQADIQPTEMPATQGHGQGVGAKGRREQKRARDVETYLLGVGGLPGGQGPPGQQQGQQSERYVDQEQRLPAKPGHQYAAQGRAQCGTYRGQRGEQPHGAARPGLIDRFADQGQRQRHHDGSPQPLQYPGGDQQPQRRREAAQG